MAGRTALVTGAGRGIGAATAQRLSAAGYAVALTSRSVDELEQISADCPGDSITIPADITEPDAADRVVSQTEQRLGAVDVLVLNAGVAASAPLPRVTDEDWQHQLDVNLTAPFRCLRRVVPSMRERGFGRVVAVASVAAKHGDAYISAYAAAKHGLLGLVRSAASELAATGVTVNAVCPGYVDTPMTDSSIERIANKTGRTLGQARALLEARQPVERLITVEEVVAAVMSCVDNSGMNGQGIVVDGGGVQS